MQGLKSSAHPLKILAYQQREALSAGTEVLHSAAARTRPAKHWLVIAPARRNIVPVRAFIKARRHNLKSARRQYMLLLRQLTTTVFHPDPRLQGPRTWNCPAHGQRLCWGVNHREALTEEPSMPCTGRQFLPETMSGDNRVQRLAALLARGRLRRWRHLGPPPLSGQGLRAAVPTAREPSHVAVLADSLGGADTDPEPCPDISV